MFGSMGQTNVKNLGNGGTMDGDVTITGDLTVSGGIGLSLSEVIEGTSTIDVTNPEALLVRKNGDGGDVFTVNTTNSRVNVGTPTGTGIFEVEGSVDNDWAGRFENKHSGGYGGLFKVAGTTSNELVFQARASSTNILTVLGDSTVGIGTASPAKPLHIKSADNQPVRVESTDPYVGIEFKDVGSSTLPPLISVLSDDFIFYGGHGSGRPTILTLTSSSQLATFAGNIRTGTSVETANTNFDNLVIEGSSHTGISIFSGVGGSDSDGGIYFGDDDHNNRGQIKYAHSNNSMSFTTNDTTALTIDSNQDVGIGCTPSSGVRLRIEDTNATMRLQASNDGGAVEFLMYPDIASDNADLRRIKVVDGGTMTFESYRSGSFASDLTLDGSDGSATFSGGITMEGASGSTLTLKSTNTNITGAELVGKLEAYISDASGNLPGVAGSIDWTTSGSIDGGSTKGTNLTFKNYIESDGLQTVLAIGADKQAMFYGNVELPDNTALNFGDSDDSQFFNTGSAQYFRNNSSDMDFIFQVNDGGSTQTELMRLDASVPSVNVSGILNVSGAGLKITGQNTAHVASSIVLGHEGSSKSQIRAYGADDSTKGSLEFNMSSSAGSSSSVVMILDGNSKISLSNNDSGTSNTIFGKNAGDSDGAGDQNVYIGELAGGTGTQTDASDGNVGVGYNSLTDITTGQQNTSVGSYNSDDITTGSYNTSVGRSTLATLTTGSSNVAVGRATLSTAADDESHNIAIGNSALGAAKQDGTASSTNREIKRNIAIGEDALIGGTLTGTNHLESNIAIGYQAMDATGANNQIGTIAIGTSALGALTEGQYNTAIGFESQIYQTDGANNTTLGYKSFRTADNGESNNVVIGYQAGLSQNHASSDNNVFIGSEACVGGTGNRAESVAIGYRAWGNGGSANNLGGSENVFIGAESGGGTWATAASDGNTAVGWNTMKGAMQGATLNTALGKNSFLALTKGRYNVAIGADSLYTEDVGDRTTAVGYSALYSQNSDTDNEVTGNTGVGFKTGYTNVTGTYNTYLGYNAGYGGGSSSNNVSVGANSMVAVVGGDNNVAVGMNSLIALTSGGSNVAIGKDAMVTATTAAENVAIGYEALGDVEAGSGANVAIGYYAMRNVDEGTGGGDADYNIAIGYDALKGGDFGGSDLQLQGNIAIGMQAMNSTGANAQTGTVAIGHQALKDLTSGARNTAVGYQAMDDLTVGEDNVALGYGALGGASTSSENKRNIAIGSSAMSGTNAGASQCVAVGYAALDGNLTSAADSNVAVGYYASSAVTSGANNTAVGTLSLDALTTGNQNTAVGMAALGTAVGVSNCTAIGYAAMNSANTQDGSTAVGFAAANYLTGALGVTVTGFGAGRYVTTGDYSTAFGYNALGGNSGGTAVTGNDNTALGANAGRDIEGAAEGNVLVGKDAGMALTTGNFNVLIGRDAGTALLDETHNTAIGTDALAGSSLVDQTVIVGSQACIAALTASADGTVAMGYQALTALTSGAGNLAIGFQSADAVSTGDYNTAIGYQALSTEDTGDRNTAVGYGSLLNVNGANNNANTALGFQSGDSITTGTSNTCIGASTSTSANNAVNQTVVGAGTQGIGDNWVTLGNNDVTNIAMAQDGMAIVHAGSIQFPATQQSSSDANNLDDYEEGEYATTITGATSGSWTMDSAQNKLSYTKIGRLVTVIGKFETDSGSGAGTLKINLPFTAANLTSGAGIAAGSITINRYGSTSISTQITPIVFEDANYINVQIHSTDGTSNESYLQADDVDGIFEGQLNISYFAN